MTDTRTGLTSLGRLLLARNDLISRKDEGREEDDERELDILRDIADVVAEDRTIADQLEARRWVDRYVEEIDPEYTSDDGKLGDGTETYDDWRGRRVEAFMVAGNGPTAWLFFVFDADGDLDHAYLQLTGAHSPVYAGVPEYKTEHLLAACREDKRVRDNHGRR